MDELCGVRITYLNKPIKMSYSQSFWFSYSGTLALKKYRFLVILMCSLSTSSFSVPDPSTLEKFIQSATRAPFFTPAIFSLFLQLFKILTLPYPQIRTNQCNSPSLDLIQMSSPGDLEWSAPLCFAVFSTLICSHALVRITNIGLQVGRKF